MTTAGFAVQALAGSACKGGSLRFRPRLHGQKNGNFQIWVA
jgi:hypothetical protein